MWHVIWILPAILINYFLSCKCVCIEPLTATAKKAAGKYGLAVCGFAGIISFADRLRVLCGMFARARAFVLVLPWQTNNKSYSYLCSFVLELFYVSFFFSTHSLCISVRLKQNSARDARRKKNTKERNDESNRSHGMAISVCLHANRDCWSWKIVAFFIIFSFVFVSLTNAQRYSQKLI